MNLRFFYILLLLLPCIILHGQDEPVKSSAAEYLAAAVEKHGIDKALNMFAKLCENPEDYEFSEQAFNNLGEKYLNEQQYNTASAVFRLTIDLFPDSPDGFYNLATVCMYTGDRECAEKNLKIFIELNPRFWLADFILSDLDRRMERVAEECEKSFSPGEQTGLKGPYFGEKPPGLTAKMFVPGIVSRALALNFSCTFSPDGREFYYNHFMNIMVCRLEEDGWTAPEPAEFTGGYRALEPHITPDGKKIYFLWFPPEPDESQNGILKFNQGRGIYVCEKTPGGWSVPKYVVQGGSLTSTLDGVIYVSDRRVQGQSQVKRGILENGVMTEFKDLGGGLADLSEQFPVSSHPCISPDGRTILFDTSMKSGLWAAFLDASGVWSKPVKLSDHGLSPIAGIPTYTPDGKYIFFNVAGDVYWIGSEFVEKLRPEKK